MGSLHTVTVFYYQEKTSQILHDVQNFPDNKKGRVLIPSWYKRDKCILAVCDGNVTCLKQA